MANVLVEPKSRVWPSGEARATVSVPITPDAPERLSFTTCWPQMSLRCCENSRPTKSAGPPAGNGIIMRTGRAGRVAMAADRVNGDVDGDAVDRADFAVRQHHGLFRRACRIREHRVGQF